MGIFDSFLKKKQEPMAPPEEFSGYEEEGVRDETVKEPSNMDNFRFGLEGGVKGQLPTSWAEAGGKMLAGLGKNTRGSKGGAARQDETNNQFKNIIGMIKGAF